ncbi:fimbrillin family protein [Phocaeicola barnesiae]|uniref:Fimbrillin family protein n=1 Tax=Phocaeicola barnesiae TaxID=376804 RepID=A0AAW5N1E6_9BACT|nr:fimbrillin family protein [Phocaeicola barnesiae]MCR8874426.1 fimbrillin family protein [Phocaeicola barnesiae]
MNIRLPLHILSAATVLLFAATACTQDDLGGSTLPEGEYPLVINATGLQAVATPASRATVDGDWQGVQTVALSVGGTVKEYDVTASDADGYKTAILSSDTDPFWWTSREDITVSAWWPYGTTMPDVVVKADQSTKEGFEGSDFISAEAQAVQFDHPTLEFSHRTARITVLLKPGDGITSVTGADVSVTGLGTDNGNPATIKTYAPDGDTYEALTAPQTVKANTPFIQVDLGGGTYYFRPKNDVVLAAGSRYTYTVNVNATGLTLEGCTIGDWTNGSGESGTAEDLGYFIQDDGSYTVYTANGLKEWAEAVQTDPTINCTLTADINLTGKEWTPVGNSGQTYNGTFDGQGHTITGLNISSPSEAVALFHNIGGGGKVMNLQLKNVTYKGSTAMGGIAHGNNGTITACSVMGTLTNTANNGAVGGIAAINYGTITACWFNGTITGGSNVGGIAVFNLNAGSYDGKITACYWSGDGISNGVWGGDDTSGTTKVDNSTVTWQTAVGGMNAALTGNDYQWKLGTDGLPVLQSNQ